MLCPEPGGGGMRRREFLGVLGAVMAWPLAVSAQQPAMLGSVRRLDRLPSDRAAARISSGLEGSGLYRGRERRDRIPLGENQARPAAGPGSRVWFADRSLSSSRPAAPFRRSQPRQQPPTIPIVFTIGEDPVKLGLVASLARPGGNMTGINFFIGELAAKRLELLRELVPAINRSPC